MDRYILIENNSGFIFGDSADLDGRTFTGTAVEFARALDDSIGAHGRDYALTHNPHDTSTGYHVYAATDTLPTVWDGQDDETIKAVGRGCAYIGFIAVLTTEGVWS